MRKRSSTGVIFRIPKDATSHMPYVFVVLIVVGVLVAAKVVL